MYVVRNLAQKSLDMLKKFMKVIRLVSSVPGVLTEHFRKSINLGRFTIIWSNKENEVNRLNSVQKATFFKTGSN